MEYKEVKRKLPQFNRELILEAKGQSPVLVVPDNIEIKMEVSENEN